MQHACVLQQLLLSTVAAVSFWDGHSDYPSVEGDVQVQIQHLLCH